jgi:hypothetical protein
MEGFYTPFFGSINNSVQHDTERLVEMSNALKMEDSLCGIYIRNVAPLLPIKWSSLKPDPLHVLLDHSDCDGYIKVSDARKIAKRLEEILPLLPDEDAGGHIGNWREKTQTFIDGLKRAVAERKRVEFH